MEDNEGTLHIDISQDSEANDLGFDIDGDTNAGTEKFTLEINTDDANPMTIVDDNVLQLQDTGSSFISYNDQDEIIRDQYIEINDICNVQRSCEQSAQSAVTQTESFSDDDNSPKFTCGAKGCSKVCMSASHLRIHKRSHTGEKPHKCSWRDCAKAFSTRYALKSHLRVHTGEKPYNCTHPGCSKAFKTAGDLQKHIRTHTGEKPFKCPFDGCGKAFTTSNIRKVHMRTHTGERPYKCPFTDCEKTFSTATNYNNHVRIHTGEKPFWCDYPGCGKRFTEYSSYYKHRVVHTDRNIYTCSHCGRYYSYPATLLSHKKSAHNDGSTIQDIERIKSARKHKVDVKGERRVDTHIATANIRMVARNEEITSGDCTKESHVVLLPVNPINAQASRTTSTGDSQVAAVMAGGSGKQLAILTHNGRNQQFTLALTDRGSTVLLPSTASQNSYANGKIDSPIVYVSSIDPPRVMEIMEKDNTLQRMEASESNTSSTESTPINEDIWLHQPQKEDISADIVIKEDQTPKDCDSMNLNIETSQNPCDDSNSTDSIAYLEIGGAKYQLKIVLAENEADDQLCMADQSGSAVHSSSENQELPVPSNSAKLTELNFWSAETFPADRLDPEGSQRCEPFCKKKKL